MSGYSIACVRDSSEESFLLPVKEPPVQAFIVSTNNGDLSSFVKWSEGILTVCLVAWYLGQFLEKNGAKLSNALIQLLSSSSTSIQSCDKVLNPSLLESLKENVNEEDLW